MKIKKYLSSVFIIISFLMLTGAPARSETIDIVGTGDGMTILKALARAFQQAYPEHAVNVPESIGSSGGIKSVGNDKNPIGRIARKIKDKEKPYGLTRLPIAKFPVVFFLNKSVGVTNLSIQQINDIYSGKITNWNAVGGPDGKIRVVRREESDSSLENLRDTLPGFNDIAITKRSKTITLTQENLNFVAFKPGAIGFGPFSDAVKANVDVLMIDDMKPTDKNYPSFGVLALIFKAVNRKGAVSAFIDFVTTPNAAKVIGTARAIPYEQQNTMRPIP
jgi:phosphate transport system substrate-binding protein